MSYPLRWLGGIVLAGWCCGLCGAFGQGSAADYERAANLRKLTENKVFKTQVKPHWFRTNTWFWYRNDLAGGQREFVVVDAVNGVRRPAFDHGRLAAALSKAAGREIDPGKLPIEDLEFHEQPSSVVVRGDAGAWVCELPGYDLRRFEGGASGRQSLPGSLEPRASRSTGPETSVRFVNHARTVVQVYWSDPEGSRRKYADLQPEQEHVQHTYAGHVWIVTGPGDKVMGVYEAGDSASDAVIDEKGESARPQRESRRRRDRGSDTSGDGQWQAFCRNGNLYVRSPGGGQEHQLTEDGTSEEEYGGRFWWSPDSKKLVVLKTKKAQEHKVYYVESSPPDQLQPKLHSYDYLKPGDRIAQSRPCLFDMGTKKQVPVSNELFPNPWSISELRWDPDSSMFSFLYNQRGHQVLRVVTVSATTGEAKVIIDETSATFVDYEGKSYFQRIEGTGEILWMSERDGWNHLYLYDGGKGTVKNQITRGEWVVRGVERVDPERRQIWFRAGGIRPGQDPYHVHHARVNFDGSGLTVLTEGDGTHSVQYSPDEKYLIDTWSRVDQPPRIELRGAADGKLVCELERADWTELLGTGWRAPERFAAKGRDGVTDIYGIVILPTRMSRGVKYPVIEEIYAGPQGAFVPKSFRAYYAMQSLAELGFVMVQIDGMGTSQRSKKFHDVCWKNLGDSGFPDRIAWMKAAATKHPFMDLSRVGIYGGSAGGQSSTGALLAHGDFYKVAVSDCGCHDNRMDKIWWNELWMGWPIGPHYEEQSNVTQAHRLQGKLLLMVGEMDQNVDPASTMQVVNALIKANKDFDLVVMTGKGHGSAENEYGRRRRADFFVRHLLGREPRWNSTSAGAQN